MADGAGSNGDAAGPLVGKEAGEAAAPGAGGWSGLTRCPLARLDPARCGASRTGTARTSRGPAGPLTRPHSVSRPTVERLIRENGHIFTEAQCKVCSALLISESQRLAHYQVGKGEPPASTPAPGSARHRAGFSLLSPEQETRQQGETVPVHPRRGGGCPGEEDEAGGEAGERRPDQYL